MGPTWTEMERDELEDGTVVSTVQKHGMFFETLVLGGPLDLAQLTYSDADRARSGHALMLARVMQLQSR